MKNKIIILTFAAISFISCKEKANEELIVEDNNKTAPTYAEISVKDGGNWIEAERRYEGGEFKNISKLEVPALHTDHSYFIRYEGPGWENSQIGYRIYLDWRNAIDIFGKKVDSLVLPQVGQDGFDSYHEDAPWGQDILKAGKSLGIGSYGRFVNDSVAHFREVENTFAEVVNSEGVSTVNIQYKGWKTGDVTTNLDSRLSIFPADRFTKAELTTSSEIEGLCTGIVKFDDIPLLQKTSPSGNWKYIATYGTQTLVNDNDKLGMAIFYKTDEVQEEKEGPFDHLLIFKPTTNKITYYFLGAWEQEKNGIKNQAEFLADLDKKLVLLDEKGILE
jgi:hypothetical protein